MPYFYHIFQFFSCRQRLSTETVQEKENAIAILLPLTGDNDNLRQCHLVVAASETPADSGSTLGHLATAAAPLRQPLYVRPPERSFSQG